MENQELRITNIRDIESEHVCEHASYEYVKYEVTERGKGNHGQVTLYEIFPGKANYPYHYHASNEEVFYILDGQGVVDTPQGRRSISAGDFIICPSGEKGAHKITNSSQTEKLVYIDFDTVHSPEVVYYPDSNKVGIYVEGIEPEIFKNEISVDYYEGE